MATAASHQGASSALYSSSSEAFEGDNNTASGEDTAGGSKYRNANVETSSSSLDLDTPVAAADADDGDASQRHSSPPWNDARTSTPNRRNKSSFVHRWAVLALVCAVMTASYYAYDIPSALHQQLQDYMHPSTNFETKFNLLYTVYSIPNVILPLFGGNFVDKYGAPYCFTLFASLGLLGSSLLAMGVANKNWGLMFFGRVIFGLGGESLCVAQSTILSQWFEGKEVAFAFGVGLALSRLGSIWNNIVSPRVANSSHSGGTVAAFWVGALFVGLSVLASVLVVLIDRKVSKTIAKRENGDALTSLTAALLDETETMPGASAGEPGHREDWWVENEGAASGSDARGKEAATAPCKASDEIHITDITRFGSLFWLLSLSCFVVYGCVLPFNNIASGLLLERNYFTSSPADCQLQFGNQCTVGYLQKGENPSLDSNGDTCVIGSSQAPLIPSSVNFTRDDSDKGNTWEEPSYIYASLEPSNVDCGDPFWSEGCTSDYCSKQNSATEHAGKVMSIPYFISALSSPALGHLVDKIGRRAQIASFASALLLMVHVTLALSTSSPIVPLIGQGIAYSLYAAVIWPSVPLTVSKHYTGTAFGVITSIQNIGLAIFPLIIAAIYNTSSEEYIPNVEFFFVSCALAGVLVGIGMNYVDKLQGGKLNSVAPHINEDPSEIDDIRESNIFADVNEDLYFSPLIGPQDSTIV